MNMFDRFVSQRDSALVGGPIEWDREADFNWALDYFDKLQSDSIALIDLGSSPQRWTYRALSLESNALANRLIKLGVNTEDKVMVLLENSSNFYLTMLALIKLRCFFVPCAASLTPLELQVRIDIMQPTSVITTASGALKYVDVLGQGINKKLAFVGSDQTLSDTSWRPLQDHDLRNYDASSFSSGPGSDPMMGVFTSGTTSLPKLVVHSHVSYPVGHLSSVYWQGVSGTDIHMNIAHPGWAKHSWSSFFVPLSVGATVLIPPAGITEAARILDAISDIQVTSICAPPSWWRQLAKSEMQKAPHLRNGTAAGEALDPQVKYFFKSHWQLELRDGYGQSELTAVFGHCPDGTISSWLPGYHGGVLLDKWQEVCESEGELAFVLKNSPLGLMLGYYVHGEVALPEGRYYRTGDLIAVEAGSVTLTGRCTNVFKSYDVKISPEELERNFMTSGLLEDILIYEGTDSHGEPVPFARCVAREPGLSPEIMRAWQLKHLSGHQHVSRFDTVDSIPRNISGKKVRA